MVSSRIITFLSRDFRPQFRATCLRVAVAVAVAAAAAVLVVAVAVAVKSRAVACAIAFKGRGFFRGVFRATLSHLSRSTYYDFTKMIPSDFDAACASERAILEVQRP